MHTARVGGGGELGVGVSSQGGGSAPGGVPGPGGWSQGGVPGAEGGGSAPRGASGPGGLPARGVVSQHALRQTPPPPDRILDTCYVSENITLSQTSFAGGENEIANIILKYLFTQR